MNLFNNSKAKTLPFKAKGSGKIQFLVDFASAEQVYASFLDDKRKNALFHLSLRPKTGLAVVNSQRKGEWGKEIHETVELSETGDEIAVSFYADTVTVHLNGSLLFSLDKVFDLDLIEQVRLSDGISARSVRMSGEANQTRLGTGTLNRSGFLQLSGWAVDPAMQEQVITLVLQDTGEVLPFVPLKRPDIAEQYQLPSSQVGVLCHLPGRLWEPEDESQDAARESLTLQLLSNGVACGEPLRITRDEVTHWITEHVSSIDIHTHAYDLLLAAEHVRHARLWSLLPKPTQLVMAQAAKLYGVSEYLLEGQGETNPQAPDEHTGAIDSKDLLLLSLQNAFGREVRKGDGTPMIGVLSTLLQDYPLSQEMRAHLFLSLAEVFSGADAFEDLYKYSLVHLKTKFQPINQSWHSSAILPFLYLDGRLTEISEIMWGLSDQEGWIVTSTLGWMIKRMLRDRHRPSDMKLIESILYAFMQIVDRRAKNYWDHSPCVHLIDATLAMVAKRENQMIFLSKDITAFAIRNYGLSRSFWKMFEGLSLTSTADPLVVGRRHFEVIEDLEGCTADDRAKALAFFRNWGNPDVMRFELELLDGFGADADYGPAALLAQEVDLARSPEERLLRHLARPECGTTESEDTWEIATEVLRSRDSKISRSPFYRQQFNLARDIEALVANPATTSELLPRILTNLSLLSAQRNGFLGIGMALRLIEALVRLGQDAPALRVLASLEQIYVEMPKDRRDTLLTSSPLLSSLQSLARPDLHGNPTVQATLQLFPTVVTPPSGDATMDLHESHGPTTPIYNTIVTVLSCRPFLTSRIDAIRQTWLAELKALGIPYVVVVGDGDNRLDGDVLHLEAPDDYEGLPQKTLNTIRWVHNHTAYTHMLKIDDDCFLDANNFFRSLSYLKFDYYGRILRRQVGQMDRSWHFQKSRTVRGLKELDKSPEPSTYCDGGTGYTLSRQAMQSILAQAEQIESKKLIQSSFMEDKMVGDLLALSEIDAQEEDYYVALQRRSHSAAIPVSRWQNAFYPCPISPTKLVHLDTPHAQSTVFSGLKKPNLWPRKLWPTYLPAQLGYDTNALELVSSESDLTRMNAEDLAVVSCVRNEMFILPHFIAHYRKLGVKSFIIIDNFSEDGTLEYLLEQPDVVVFSADTSYNKSQYAVAWQMAAIANLRVGRWSLVADADELLIYPDWKHRGLPETLRQEAYANADAVQIYMLDMYPKGRLSEATFESGDLFAEAGYVDRVPLLRNSTGRGPFSNSATVTSALRHRLIPHSRPELFVAQKMALLKYAPWMRPSAGLHYVADTQPSTSEMIFAHFKYNSNFRQKSVEEVARGQHYNNAEEYRKYLSIVSEGRETIYDPKISVPWQECQEVQRILNGYRI